MILKNKVIIITGASQGFGKALDGVFFINCVNIYI